MCVCDVSGEDVEEGVFAENGFTCGLEHVFAVLWSFFVFDEGCDFVDW